MKTFWDLPKMAVSWVETTKNFEEMEKGIRLFKRKCMFLGARSLFFILTARKSAFFDWSQIVIFSLIIIIIKGWMRSLFLCRSTPFCALKRLIGLLQRAVNQASGGFWRFWEARTWVLSDHRKGMHRVENRRDAFLFVWLFFSTLTSVLSACCVTNSHQLPFFAKLTISLPMP